VDLEHTGHRAGERVHQLAGQRADGTFDGHDPVVDVELEPLEVLLRLARGPGRAWLDLRGLTYLQLPAPEET
jgi:hypothetical protein